MVFRTSRVFRARAGFGVPAAGAAAVAALGVRDFSQQRPASMGLTSFGELGPEHVLRRIDPARVMTYAELYVWLDEGELLAGAKDPSWARDWEDCDAHHFRGARPSSALRRG